MFPYTRLRRTRRYAWLRDMVAETNLTTEDLVQPIFICEGENIKREASKLPGQYVYSINMIDDFLKQLIDNGINAIMLFPEISDDLKTEDASEAYNQDNLVCRCIRHIKNKFPNIGVICDVALDPYTTHGHDGIIKDDYVDNDLSLEALNNQSLCLAKAGADMVAPSDMMDGRIGSIREMFEENGFHNVGIISYAAKYASALYGPFRDTLGSQGCLGVKDKKTYQMDYRNIKEATREVQEDIEEGADAVIVKPATIYSDVIHRIAENFDIPVFAYHVSGEYAMLKYSNMSGAVDFDKILIETLTSLKRAGASSVISYGALEAAKLINKK